MTGVLRAEDLGRIGYSEAYAYQVRCVESLLAAREAAVRAGRPLTDPGRVLMLEHDPVITVSRRPGARAHLIADEARLAREGVTIAETDRGGDITYHGPGQLVVYPILDLNALRLRLHDYMRALEESVIRLCDRLGLHAQREPGATGVWIRTAPGEEPAKVCAMGVRVTRWVSMHGLALNVNPRMDHFDLIVPCGLIGRRVTSLRALMGDRCPDMPSVKAMLAEALAGVLGTRLVWERRAV